MHRSRQVPQEVHKLRLRRTELQLRRDLDNPQEAANPERIVAIIEYIQRSVQATIAYLSISGSQPTYPQISGISFDPPIPLNRYEYRVIKKIMDIQLQDALLDKSGLRLIRQALLVRLLKGDIDQIVDEVLGEVNEEISRVKSYKPSIGEPNKSAEKEIATPIAFALRRLGYQFDQEYIDIIKERITSQLLGESYIIEEQVIPSGHIFLKISWKL